GFEALDLFAPKRIGARLFQRLVVSPEHQPQVLGLARLEKFDEVSAQAPIDFLQRGERHLTAEFLVLLNALLASPHSPDVNKHDEPPCAVGPKIVRPLVGPSFRAARAGLPTKSGQVPPSVISK